MISKAELLQGRDKSFAAEYTQQISDNLDVLLEKINVIRAAYGLPLKVNSGWRPPSVNALTAGASPNSNHCLGLAIDLNDPAGDFFHWCLANLDLLTAAGLYMEHPNWTRTKNGGWVHLQCIPPKSKKRIFIPNQSLPFDPNFFNGRYDSKYDK